MIRNLKPLNALGHFMVLVAFLIGILALPIGPAAAFTDDEKDTLHQIIRDYLIANPEVILEAQTVLEEKQAKAAQDAIKSSITQLSNQLFTDGRDMIFGNPNGDIAIVEFFDYNCGYCKRAMADMEEVVRRDDNVKFILKELPVLGEQSTEAARISIAVSRIAPDKAVEFHTRLLGASGRAGRASAMAVAANLDIALEDIEQELQANDLMDPVRLSYQLAQALGINGTPSYVIGKEPIYGAVGVEQLLQRVANMRACGETTC